MAEPPLKRPRLDEIIPEHDAKAIAGPDEWSYRDQVILAPMVRIGTLPMRLLAQKYGCRIAYGEEIVDKKIAKCRRVVNTELGTVDFCPPNQPHSVFSTVPGERVVFQVGTADAVSALQAAQVVAADVRAIDVNMGCPKHFSVQGGMGAALLSKPETVRDILTTLRRNLPSSLHVTCKIRLLDRPQDTIQLARLIESCGVSAFAIHGRRIPDRPRHQAMVGAAFGRSRERRAVPLCAFFCLTWSCQPEEVPIVVQSVDLPVIYNGDVFHSSDIAKMREITGATSVMIARGAQWNASIFRPDGKMLPLYDVARDYLEIAGRYNNLAANTKYALLEMLKEHVAGEPEYQSLIRSKTHTQLVDAVEALGRCAKMRAPYVAPQPRWEERPAAGRVSAGTECFPCGVDGTEEKNSEEGKITLASDSAALLYVDPNDKRARKKQKLTKRQRKAQQALRAQQPTSASAGSEAAPIASSGTGTPSDERSAEATTSAPSKD